MSWLDGNSNQLAYLIFRHRKVRILHILVKISSKWFTTWLQEESMNKEQYYTSSECQQHLHKQNHWETQDWCPPEIINSRLSKSIRKQDLYGYVECLKLVNLWFKLSWLCTKKRHWYKCLSCTSKHPFRSK